MTCKFSNATHSPGPEFGEPWNQCDCPASDPLAKVQIVRDEEGWCLIVQDGPGHWSRVAGSFSSRREARMRVQQGIDLWATLGDSNGLPTRDRPQLCDPAGSGGDLASDRQQLIGSVQSLKDKLADMMRTLAGYLLITEDELRKATCTHYLMLLFDGRDVAQEAHEIDSQFRLLGELVWTLDAIDPGMVL
ncbi:hypothetical protein [Tautonia plasticadhaerens]|uniref:Uncharacterized protein n=1 Tax=Tautonia plasticadhaerens TaxID=2527974 RepID=A0A518H7X4_9BACT|nr:hypothetical protein [Tautonia plasticadhaerens]QDV36968.1 hypothetical protein ElP_48990 [Tautonia plasticadhaerens]